MDIKNHRQFITERRNKQLGPGVGLTTVGRLLIRSGVDQNKTKIIQNSSVEVAISEGSHFGWKY